LFNCGRAAARLNSGVRAHVKITRRQAFSFALYVSAAISALFAYRFSWSAGCLFDGKSGIGSYEAAGPFLTASWWAVLAALILVVSAAPIGWAKSRESAVGLSVLGLVVAIPLLFSLMWVAEGSGVQTCAP
jgi:hypothetical protein